MPRPARACLALVLVLSVLDAPTGHVQSRPLYDLVIAGGLLIDGSGSSARLADVAVRNGRIVAIGRLRRSDAAEAIDATGLAVAPGFIDVHTHADDLADHPLAENFVRMGVTSIVAGNCGTSALDVGDALTRIRQVGAAVNFATLVGHNTVREAAMGRADRRPSLPELARMKSRLWRAMTDGAVGFSTGLQYVPGTYARTPEIIELARVAANAGGVYASHMRNEGTEIEASIAETIQVGAVAGARIQISHLKIDSPSRWGASIKALEMMDAARARGITIEADQYAYTAASSSLDIRFPSWALEGGAAKTAERLQDPATWARIKLEIAGILAGRGLKDLSFAVVASAPSDPSLSGLSMEQIALRAGGSGSADAQLEAARDLMLHGGASMVYHLMSDEDVDRIMKDPHVAIASDSSLQTMNEGAPHPRGYGNTARVLGEYVRERHVLALEEAVRKMTSLPARQFRFAWRGLVKEGYAADLVVFDARTIVDRATFEKPHAYPGGIPYVLVNGVKVVAAGVQTSARPGVVLTTEPGGAIAR